METIQTKVVLATYSHIMQSGDLAATAMMATATQQPSLIALVQRLYNNRLKLISF